MEDVEIYRKKITNNKGENIDFIVLRGGLQSENPRLFMDKAVSDFVANKPYNQFVEIHLDSPWVRVIISGINDLDYTPLNEKDRL